MKTPLALFAVAVLSPIAATTVVSLGLIASSSAFALGRLQRQTASAARASGTCTVVRHDLCLDACQDTLWTKAERADREANATRLERLRESHDTTLALLKEPDADLQAVARRIEDFKANERRLDEAISERWRAVYETLDAGQKNRAGHFFKDKLG